MTGPHADPHVAEEPPELSIVLPAYNEATMLGSTVTDLAKGLDERGRSYELVVVENGSRDDTLQLARLLADQFRGVEVLTLPVGDYGAALRAGFHAARGAVVVNFDVDYYDLSFLDRALELLEETSAAVVVASKRAPGADDRRPLHRRLVTFVFTTLLSRLFGLPVTDAHGMKAMRREAVAPAVEACVMTRSLFDVELVLRAGRAGLEVLEVPAFVVELRPARSAISRRAAETVLGLVRLAIVLRRTPPVAPARPQSADPPVPPADSRRDAELPSAPAADSRRADAARSRNGESGRLSGSPSSSSPGDASGSEMVTEG